MTKLPKGVCINKNKFRASIRLAGVRINLGQFDTPELASVAYEKARATTPDRRKQNARRPTPEPEIKPDTSGFPLRDPHTPSLSTLWNDKHGNKI